MLVILVGELGSGLFSYYFYKLAWKKASLLALATAKHCPDLTLLCIDNQYIFLQHHAASLF